MTSTPPPPLTLLIAAHDPNQGAALAEMIQSLRPGVHVVQFGESESESGAALGMIVESSGEQVGELSRRVRARHPELALVVIASRFDERAIDEVAKIEAAAIVASPCEPGALLRVLEAQARKVRYPGRCDAVETGELLRLHASARSSGILHLRAGDRSGAIYLEDGQPVHAHCDGHKGADAVRELLEWADVRATWIAGRSASARTIDDRIEVLLERDLGAPEPAGDLLDAAPREVLEKIKHLATARDILAAYLLHDMEIVDGTNDSNLDEAVVGRALSQLAQVFQAMEDQQGDGAGSEIQASVGVHRLVVDRMGPSRFGYQVGVVVKQASPVCKSLRRLLRQIDRGFRKSLAEARQQEGSPGTSSGSTTGSTSGSPAGLKASGAGNAASLHRVA